MGLIFYLCIIALVFQISLSAIVFIKDPRKEANQAFTALLAFFFALTLAELYIITFGLDETKVKILMTPGIFIPYFFCVFTSLFPTRQTNSVIIKSRLHMLLFLVPAGLIAFLLWQGRLIKEVSYIKNGFTLVWTNYEFLFKIIMVSYLAYSLSILSKSSKEADTKIKRRRLKYTFAAILLPITASATFVALSKLYISGSTAYTFGLFPALSIVMGIMLSYAMLKYNLLEIDIIFSIGLIYTLLTAILAGSMELLQELMQNILNLSGVWAKIISTLFIAAIFSPLKEFIINFVDGFFGRKGFNVAHSMQRILDETRKTKSEQQALHKFLYEISLITESTFLAILLERGLLASYPDNDIRFQFSKFEIKSGISDIDALIEILNETSQDYLKQLKESGVKNIFSIGTDEKSIGYLLAGHKKTKLPYSEQELSLMESASAELPHILDNINMINDLVNKDRTINELKWAKKMLHSISAPENVDNFADKYNIATYTSLASNVKGDMIDYCNNRNDTFLGIYDAVNHGIQAVLALNVIFSVFRSSEEKIFTANRILKEYSELDLRSAVTLLSIENDALKITNAGNPSPIHVVKDSKAERITENGIPLGMDKMKSFTTIVSLSYCKGDFLLLSTNGLYKFFKKTNYENLNTFLTNSNFDDINTCHSKLTSLIENMPNRSEFEDDITYILIERKQK